MAKGGDNPKVSKVVSWTPTSAPQTLQYLATVCAYWLEWAVASDWTQLEKLGNPVQKDAKISQWRTAQTNPSLS